MKKIIQNSVILVIGILLGIGGFYFFTNLMPNIQSAKINNESAKTGSQIVALGNGWQRYTNYTLGFSIDLPEKSYVWERDCKFNGIAPVTVKEINNKLVIGHICNGEFKYFQGLWEIAVYKNVDTFDQLQDIFKKKYYNTCEIGSLIPIGEGNFNVINKNDGKELSESSCFINWMSAFIYNPELKKVAAWSMGQEALFVENPQDISGEQGISYDTQMKNSFKFIK